MSKIWEGGISDSKGPDLSELLTSDDLKVDNFMIRYEILGLLAYHIELSNSEVIPELESKEIISALLSVLDRRAKIPGQYEDVHSYVQDMVSQVTPYWKDLRIFLSRNDQSHTNIRLYYSEVLLDLSVNLLEMCRASVNLLNKADGVMAGYTHNRQAMPTRFSTYLDFLARSFLEIADLAKNNSLQLIEKCPLGYGSGYGSRAPVDKNSLSRRLGFKGYFENPIHGSSHRGVDDADVAYLVVKLFTFISKLAQDLMYFSSDELGFIKLPGGYVTGSSLMPNKRNPDFLEMLQGYASESIGNFVSTASILLNKGAGYHREFQISKDKTVAQLQLALSVTRAMVPLIKGLSFDPELARRRVLNSTFATDYANSLFQQGLSWKDSYAKTGEELLKGNLIKELEPEPLTSLGIQKIDKAVMDTKSIMERRKEVFDTLLADARELVKLKH